MSIIFSGPFLSMFLLLLSGKDMKVIPNPILFRGLWQLQRPLLWSTLKPWQTISSQISTFNKLLFLYYCPKDISPSLKIILFPLNYSTFFTLLVHCYITPTIGMYPGMNYVCLIQETIPQFIHGHNNDLSPQLLYWKIHMSILMSNLISCDMMGHPAERALYLRLRLLWPRTMDYIFLRMTIKVSATPQPVIKSSLLHHWRSSRLRFSHSIPK